jgi:hypothetical protein
MNIPAIDIKVLLLILLSINLTLVFIIKADLTFWISIPFRTILLVSMFLLKRITGSTIQKQEKEYSTNTGNERYEDFQLWQKLKKQRVMAHQKSITLFRVLGLQTILTLIFQIIAYRRFGNQKLFWWTRTAFGILTLVYFIFELRLAIVPTGPLI